MREVEKKDIPENWVWSTLGEVFDWGSGGTPKRTNPAYYDGDIPWLIIRDLNDGPIGDSATKINEEGLKNSSAKWVEPGSVLVAMYGSIGKLGLATERLTTNQAIAFTQPEPNDAKYLFYYLMLSRNALARQGKGIAQKNISQTVLKAFPFPLAPLEQQKLIVAKIEELFSHIDAGIEALKKAKHLLKQYRQSVLKAAVTGELTKEWRDAQGRASVAGGRTPGATEAKHETAQELLERILKERRQKWEEQQLEQFKAKGKTPKDDKWKDKYKEPLGYSYEGKLPEIPDSWMWVSPEQVASTDDYALAIGPFGSNLKVSDYRDEGVPLVFVRNIRAHDYSTVNAKYVTHKKAKELRAHSISGGDVLITKMGEPPGDASIYPLTAPDAIITADCIKWRFSKLIEHPELFVHIINSQIVKDQILRRTKGVAQKKISLGTFKSVAFPLPPLEEQAEILRKLEQKFYASDRLMKELDVQLLKTERNKQSILASAFSGLISHG